VRSPQPTLSANELLPTPTPTPMPSFSALTGTGAGGGEAESEPRRDMAAAATSASGGGVTPVDAVLVEVTYVEDGQRGAAATDAASSSSVASAGPGTGAPANDSPFRAVTAVEGTPSPSPDPAPPSAVTTANGNANAPPTSSSAEGAQLGATAKPAHNQRTNIGSSVPTATDVGIAAAPPGSTSASDNMVGTASGATSFPPAVPTTPENGKERVLVRGGVSARILALEAATPSPYKQVAIASNASASAQPEESVSPSKPSSADVPGASSSAATAGATPTSPGGSMRRQLSRGISQRVASFESNSSSSSSSGHAANHTRPEELGTPLSGAGSRGSGEVSTLHGRICGYFILCSALLRRRALLVHDLAPPSRPTRLFAPTRPGTQTPGLTRTVYALETETPA
jgi:hypothetical protein